MPYHALLALIAVVALSHSGGVVFSQHPTRELRRHDGTPSARRLSQATCQTFPHEVERSAEHECPPQHAEKVGHSTLLEHQSNHHEHDEDRETAERFSAANLHVILSLRGIRY